MLLLFFIIRERHVFVKYIGTIDKTSMKNLLTILPECSVTAVFFKLEPASETPRGLIKTDCWASEFLIQ